jgi:hypothetical protein
MPAGIRPSTIQKAALGSLGHKPSITSWRHHSVATTVRFQPVARYGFVGSEVDFLEPDPDPKFKKISEYVSPKIAGELFFYLNDAVFAAPRRYQLLYADNKGCISLFIKQSK